MRVNPQELVAFIRKLHKSYQSEYDKTGSAFDKGACIALQTVVEKIDANPKK